MSELKPICLWEQVFKDMGFKLTHDGQNNPGQIVLPPTEVQCFTRKYQLFANNTWQNRWVIFRYDNRSHFVDMELYTKEPNLQGREKMTMKRPEHPILEEVKKELPL